MYRIRDSSKIHLKHYHFRLKTPLKLQSGQTLTHREGLLLYYPINDFYIVSDVAPLPGFSHESLDDISNEISQISQISQNTIYSPSLQFGIESLELMATSITENRPLTDVIAETLELPLLGQALAPITCITNGLLSLAQYPLENDINQLLSQGIRTIKLKVGYQPYEDERPYLEQLFLQFRDRVTFRIDPNQQWTPDIVSTFFNTCATDCVEYIEDPVATVDELRQCHPYFSKIALDHFLSHVGHDLSLLRQFIIVYKPTLNGGFKRLTTFLSQLSSGQKVVISHSFESGVGLYYLTAIAQCLSPNTVHGLNPHYLPPFITFQK
jgi:O-succinylbenzoate synthase